MNVTDSLRKRFAYKVGTNFVGLLFSFGTQSIIPRALGPSAYGNFNYLFNFFTQFVGFLELGSSQFLYVEFCKRSNDSSLLAFAFVISSLIALVLLGLVNVAALSGKTGVIWPDQELIYIYLAALFAFLVWFSQRLVDVMDAGANTVKLERFRIFQRFLGFFAVFLLFIFSKLDLTTFFYQNIALSVVLSSWLLLFLLSRVFQPLGLKSFSRNSMQHHFRQMIAFVHPLFIFTLVSLVSGLLDRWLLQTYAGSVQQGFFGLSSQISNVCFLLTGAMTPLLAREYTLAHASQNNESLKNIFEKYLPVFYLITAYISCFVCIEASEIAWILGGSQYHNASLAVAIMALYPIHQTYGQLVGSFFFSTKRTVLYSKINILMSLLGVLAIVVLFVGGKNWLGIEVGANILATKIVVFQFITVNVFAFYAMRFIGLRFRDLLLHQFLVVSTLLLIAISTKFLIGTFLHPSNRVVQFLLCGILYTAISVICIWCFRGPFKVPDQIWKKR